MFLSIFLAMFLAMFLAAPEPRATVNGGGCMDGNPDGASAAASPFDQERLAHFS